MTARAWHHVGTGGGCTALQTNVGGLYALLTDADREALAPDASTTTFVLGLYLDTADGSNDQIDYCEGTRAECEAWLADMLARTFSVNGEDAIDLATLASYNRHDIDAVLGASRLAVGETWGGGAGGDVRRIS